MLLGSVSIEVIITLIEKCRVRLLVRLCIFHFLVFSFDNLPSNRTKDCHKQVLMENRFQEKRFPQKKFSIKPKSHCRWLDLFVYSFSHCVFGIRKGRSYT